MRASSVPRLDYLTRFNASRTVLEKTLGGVRWLSGRMR